MSNQNKSKKNHEDFKQDDILQAVVIADSFNVRFAPITHHKPRTLLPLANVPLIDYTFEFLCTAGIQEIIVFCCSHADQVKQHLRSSKWLSESSPCKVQIVSSEDSRSVGDALRDIDAKGLIKSDFVLVNGDLVSNMKLKEVIEIHKARHLRDKTPIMTMVFKQANPQHRTRCKEDEVILAIKAENSRILHYQKVEEHKKFDFPLTMFQDHTDLELQYDLLDCHLSICSPQVPYLYTENFDYSTRDDFVKGILINEEILGNTIHVHIISDEYAVRVSNLPMYDAVSKDVLNRWVYPLVPDCNITNKPTDKYNYGRHNVYLHKDVTLARGCVLVDDVIIGQGAVVGGNTKISHSVIGKNCHIGKNVELEGAYIWDNVRIDDGSEVTMSLLADNVHLLAGSKLQRGCVLSMKVTVGPHITLPAMTVLSAEPIQDEFSELQNAELTASLGGTEGLAYVYKPLTENDEELDDLASDMWGAHIQSDGEDNSVPSNSSDEDSMSNSPAPADDAQLFYEEVLSTLQRAIKEKIEKDNLVLEINSLKAAYFMQIKEVNYYVTKGIVEFPLIKDSQDLSPKLYLFKFHDYLNPQFLDLLKNYIRNPESQTDCLDSIEDLSLVKPVVRSVLMKLLHLFYDRDVLSEDVIIKWYYNIPHEVENIDVRKTLRKEVKSLIEWLQEAEEESSDEES